jgi:ELWxxDGT repeat protein
MRCCHGCTSKGISTGDFSESLQALLGDAGGLSPNVNVRLKEQWSAEYEAWTRRDLRGKQFAYVWADGIHVNVRLKDTENSVMHARPHGSDRRWSQGTAVILAPKSNDAIVTSVGLHDPNQWHLFMFFRLRLQKPLRAGRARRRRPGPQFYVEQLETRIAPSLTGMNIPVEIKSEHRLYQDGTGDPWGDTYLKDRAIGSIQSRQEVAGRGFSEGSFAFTSSGDTGPATRLRGSLSATWNATAVGDHYQDEGTIYYSVHYYVNSVSMGTTSPENNPVVYRFHSDSKFRLKSQATLTDNADGEASYSVYLVDTGGPVFEPLYRWAFRGQVYTSVPSTEHDAGDYALVAYLSGSLSAGKALSDAAKPYYHEHQHVWVGPRPQTAQTFGSFSFDWTIEEFDKPDVAVTSIAFDPTKRGISVAYQVQGAELKNATELQLYWASGATTGDLLAPAGSAIQVRAGANYAESGFVSAESMGNPPPGTKYLLAIADAAAAIDEFDESNNSQTLKLDSAAILGGIGSQFVQVTRVSGPIIEATFRPAGGALTLSQAAAILGVDHFNWLQWIIDAPFGVSFARLNADNSVNTTLPTPDPLQPETALIDPDNHGPLKLGIKPPESNTYNPVGSPDGPMDHQVYYFNEPLVLDPGGLDLINPDPFTLFFRDAARFQRGNYALGGAFIFRTELVGVPSAAGGDPIQFGSPGITIHWATDAAHDGSGGVGAVEYTRSMDMQQTLPAIVSGGIRSVEFDGGPVNHAPILDPIGPQFIRPKQVLRIPLIAHDTDSGQSVSYVVTEKPAGAYFDSASRTLTWVPGLEVAPGDYFATFAVTDNGSPSLSSFERVRITVGPAVPLGAVSLLRDINPGSASSRRETGIYSPVTKVGDQVFFLATDGSGTELWKTDATAVGTTLVKNLSAATYSEFLQEATETAGFYYFTLGYSSNYSAFTELWRSDGTTGGTVRLMDSLVRPNSLTRVGTSLFFLNETDTRTTTELWVIPQGQGPTLLRSFWRAPDDLTDVGGKLFFRIWNEGLATESLWTSDGTVNGTQPLGEFDRTRADYFDTYGTVAIHAMTPMGGQLYFLANRRDPNTELDVEGLWKSDGSPSGTVFIKTLPPRFALGEGGAYTRYKGLTHAVDDRLFLLLPVEQDGFQLWISDGSDAGTELIRQLTPAIANYGIAFLADLNGLVYFDVRQFAEQRAQLWRSDGSADGTTAIVPALVDQATVLGDSFYYSDGLALERMDAESASVWQLVDFPWSDSIDLTAPTKRTPINGKLFFLAFTTMHGVEPWVYDPNGQPSIPAPPGVTGPVNGSANVYPTFTWSASSGAATYQLEVMDKSVGNALVVSAAKLPDPSLRGNQLPHNLEVGHYYVARVRAFSIDGQVSPWSSDHEFVLTLPAAPKVLFPVLPANTYLKETPTGIVWSESDGAEGYELVVLDKTAGNVPVVHQPFLSNTSFDLIAPLANGRQYSVLVRGINSAGQAGNWSTPSIFDMWPPVSSRPRPAPAPKINKTIQRSTNLFPTITWTARTGADHYEIQLVDKSTRNTVVISESNWRETSYTPPSPLLAGHKYAVRVRAVDFVGQVGGWSSDYNFTLLLPASPKVTAPLGKIATLSPTIRWTESVGAAYYELRVLDVAAGRSTVISQTSLRASWFEITSPLTPGHKYLIMVRAFNPLDQAGEWSRPANLRTL